MVTSSAVVGSSQIRILGLQRHGDHRALAHAAGKLVRVLLKALFRVRDAHIPQVFQRFFLGGSTL